VPLAGTSEGEKNSSFPSKTFGKPGLISENSEFPEISRNFQKFPEISRNFQTRKSEISTRRIFRTERGYRNSVIADPNFFRYHSEKSVWRSFNFSFSGSFRRLHSRRKKSHFQKSPEISNELAKALNFSSNHCDADCVVLSGQFWNLRKVWVYFLQGDTRSSFRSFLSEGLGLHFDLAVFDLEISGTPFINFSCANIFRIIILC